MFCGLLVLACIGTPIVASGATDLSVFAATPAYTFAPACDLAQPLVVINLNVANRGDAPSVPLTVSALDASGVLAGVPTTLPAIAPGATAPLAVPLHYVPSSVGSIGGTHAITIVLGLQRERAITLAVPAALCVTPMQRVRPTQRVPSQRAGVLLHATPAPGLSQIVHEGADTGAILLASRTLAVPTNVRIATGASDCGAHVGLIGALFCPDMIRSGNMLLIWDWQPGSGPDDIDGFRIYRVEGEKRLIETRPDKRDITLMDVPVPPGGYPGTCYAVSSYAANAESAVSPAFCPTRAETIVGAHPTVTPPTPAPRPSSHVVIHVTSDSFPMDTVVAAGGDVTWINDDGDEHSVYGAGGSFGGDLYPHGGRYMTSFRNIDNKPYVVSYLCEYHTNMIGRIMVIP